MNQNWHNFFEEDEYADIINRYKDMLSKKKSCYFDIHEFENIVDYYITQNDYKSAIESIKIGLVQHPNSASLRLKFAHVLIESGKSLKALRYISDIEKAEFYNFEVHLLKGKALNSLGKQKDANKEFSQAIKLSKEDKDDVIYDIALSFIQIDKIHEAIKYLILAYEINESNLLVIYDLALCYERIDEIEKSVFYYKKFLDIDPFAENIWFNLGLLYSSINEYDNALEAYDYSIAISPENISVYFSKADTHISNNNFYKAINVYNDLLEVDTENAQAYCFLGECYKKLESYKLALKNYNKAIKIDTTNPDAWFGIGMVFYSLKKYHQTINNLKKAIKIEPNSPEYWFVLGEVYSKMKMLNGSAKAYSKTLELDPTNYKCWLAYAKVYYKKNKIGDAINILKEACQYNENISTINYQLAAYHIYNEQPSLAYKYFEKGLSLNFREHNEVLDHFPKTKKNKNITRLIVKYQNQK